MTSREIEELYDVMRKAIDSKLHNGWSSAVGIVDDFLKRSLSQRVRAEAIAFKASLLEDGGGYENARLEYLRALSVGVEKGYSKYTIQLSIGDVCERLNLHDEAVSWYLKALETCIEADDISGGTALRRLLRLQGSALTDEQKVLCGRVAQKSWRVLCLPGEAELSDLEKTSELLIHRQQTPIVERS